MTAAATDLMLAMESVQAMAQALETAMVIRSVMGSAESTGEGLGPSTALG